MLLKTIGDLINELQKYVFEAADFQVERKLQKFREEVAKPLGLKIYFELGRNWTFKVTTLNDKTYLYSISFLAKRKQIGTHLARQYSKERGIRYKFTDYHIVGLYTYDDTSELISDFKIKVNELVNKDNDKERRQEKAKQTAWKNGFNLGDVHPSTFFFIQLVLDGKMSVDELKRLYLDYHMNHFSDDRNPSTIEYRPYIPYRKGDENEN